MRDKLTGLYSKATFLELFDQQVKKANRYKQPLALILCALDDYKNFTKKMDQDASDGILRTVGDIIERSMRDTDLAGHLDAQHFAIALPETSINDSKVLAERIRRAAHTPQTTNPRAPSLPSLSFGIAGIDLQRRRPAYLLECAEHAVARAQTGGGDQVAIWSNDRNTCSQLWENSERMKGQLQNAVSRIAYDCYANFYAHLASLTSELPLYTKYCREHAARVALFADQVAEALAWSHEDRLTLQRGALFHDIGLATFDETLLAKTTPLSSSEYDMFKEHPMLGVQILESAGFLRDELQIVLHHHERFDGDGYPDHLEGRQIPAGARIVAIAEAWDRMTTAQPYRDAMSTDEAKHELAKNAGTQFDPQLIALVLDNHFQQRQTASDVA